MQTIVDYLSRLTVGDTVVFQNLAVFPLFHPERREADYLTLDEALKASTARVTEVSSGGSVPELKFENGGSRPVLLLDGEELVGAKQNRVLNLTILAPAQKTISIPVSCVEAGRWSQSSAEFASAPRTQFAEGRRKKLMRVTESLVASGARSSDQGEVWSDISDKARRMSANSPTSAMSAIYERHEGRVEDYAGAFGAAPGQMGALFAINGAVSGFDLFDCAGTLGKLLPKLVRSYALDAIDAWRESVTAPSAALARELVGRAITAEVATFPAIGLGEDVRLTGSGFAGGALVVEKRVVHLSGFQIDGEIADHAPATGSHLARPSVRRQVFRGR